MKHFWIILVGFSLMLTSLFSSCMDDDFSTRPSDVLSFSVDTVKFDTVFTSIGSSTQKFMVYNRGKKDLKISSVRLAEGSSSKFHINMYGMSGTEYQDLIIRGRDSMYVFVEVKIDPKDEDAPILVKDSIVFETNGVRQDVKLTAYGQDVVILRGRTLSADTVFTPERPFLIYDSLVVAPGASLSLQAGCRMHFHNKASLLVKGRLQASGERSKSITFRGDRLDRMFANLPYDYLAGQWDGIRFFGDSYDNRLDFVSMRGSSTGIVADSSDVNRMKLEISNSVIHNSKGNLFTACNSKIRVRNSQLSNAGGMLVGLQGGDADFVHCTLANYYKFEIISSPLVVLRNYVKTNDVSLFYPLIQANFRNCIIHGSYTDLSLEDCPDATLTFNYLFDHCLFRSKGEDDKNFIAIKWQGVPQFLNTGDDYIFDYRIGEKSDAIKNGDMSAVAADLLYDLSGNPRPNRENPDIGAYQWVEEKTTEK